VRVVGAIKLCRRAARGVPEHIDFTSISATEDGGTTTNISRRDQMRWPSTSSNSAIVRDPAALRAVRAALESRPPPCVGIDTALRGAIAPVVISRIEHLVGSAPAGEVSGASP
jgi:hypothetical protein